MSTIIHKKSSVAGKVPLAGDLQYGELAVNYEDEKLYYKNSAGQVKSWSRNSDVYAKATETIAKGQLVMFAGSQGDHILVSKADLSAPGFVDTWIVGIAAQNFAANDYGDVVWFGGVEGIDTSAWPDGTILYASTTPGGLTSTKPTQPNHIIQIAAVTNSHANSGSLLVRPTFGAHLGDLHDVYVPAPVGNDLLKWNDATSRWENTPIKTVNGTSLIGSGNIVVSGGGGPRTVVITDGTSITVDCDTTDIATQANTQATGTLIINAPIGTPTNGQKIMIRLTSTNVQTFSWNGAFLGSTDLPLPETSSGSDKSDYLGFIYDSTASKWHIIAKNFGF